MGKQSKGTNKPRRLTSADTDGGVYEAIHKATGTSYIGQTYCLYRRFDCGGRCRPGRDNYQCHKCSVEYGSSLPFHMDVKRYGWDAFELRVLESGIDDKFERIDRENFHIAQRINTLTPSYNINQTKLGDNPYVLPERQRKRPRKAFRFLTDDEVEVLFYLHGKGYTTIAIGKLLDVTPCAVSHRVNRWKRSRPAEAT